MFSFIASLPPVKWLLSLSDINKFIVSLIAISLLTYGFSSEITKSIRQDLKETKKELREARTQMQVKEANWQRRDREKDSLHQRELDNERTIFNDFIMQTIKDSKQAQKESDKKIEWLTQKLMK